MEKKCRYWREIYEGCSDGHRTGKCSLIWKVFGYAYSFHSFISDIYIAPLQETYSEALSVQHMDTRNNTFSYEMGVGGSKVLRVSEEERVLGVSMHKSIKPSGQCGEASRNAN